MSLKRSSNLLAAILVLVAGVLLIAIPGRKGDTQYADVDGSPQPGSVQGVHESAAGSITIEELREHLFYLASDEMGGRVTGTEGYRAAVRYAAVEFERSGLKPIVKDRQGGYTFLQPVPFSRKAAGDRGRLLLTTRGGNMELLGGIDFKYLTYLKPYISDSALPVVFVGYGIEEPEAGWNDFDGLDLTGKVAIMLPGAPVREGEPLLPDELHRLYSSGNGDGRKSTAVFSRRPALLLELATEWRFRNWESVHDAADDARLIYRESVAPQVSLLSERNRACRMVATPSAVETIFRGQRFSPVRDGHPEMEGYGTFQLEGVTMRYAIECSGGDFDSYNAIGMVEGTDPVLREQYIVVGAHLDHIPPRNGQVCNGADDNASGSTGVLEIAEALVMTPPRRSVIFVLYTAEELGLYGSKHFLHGCPVPADRITACINLDMIGRTDERSRQTRSHYVVDADAMAPGFRELIAEVNQRTVDWPLDFRSLDEFHGGSDHLPFMERGIPSVFFFSGEHEDLHRPTDDPDKIEYDKMQRIAQLVYELTMELGNRDDPLNLSR